MAHLGAIGAGAIHLIRSGPFMPIDTQGGLRTFAAPANPIGQHGESGRSGL
tara:strand:- start:80 stop:232 length:153 start_codon:yes stop_codon:yes gene_type:complete